MSDSRISIFGMGYVGAVSGACLADLGHSIVGVDVSRQKVEMINGGRSPVVEEAIDELVAKNVAEGRLKATEDAEAAVLETDVSFISAGTPPGPDGAPAMGAVLAVAESIGQALRRKSTAHTVVVRSTVPPGATEDQIAPLLAQASGRAVGEGLNVCFNPEFLREGSSVKDFFSPPQNIIGSMTPEGYEVVESVYARLEAPTTRTTCRLAESVKYLCNAFHAVKISFANEAGALLKSLGMDGREAMAMFCQDTQLNISPAYLRPGFAFGGSCLPKDLQALLALARNRGVELPFLGNVLVSNAGHIERAFQMIASEGRKKVALFGLAFKHGTDDLRASPLVTLAERLLGRGFELRIHDPFVETSRLMGKNREFIDREIPHLERLMTRDAADATAWAEVIVIGHVGKEAAAAIAAQAGGRRIVDLQGVRELQAAGGRYEGICW